MACEGGHQGTREQGAGRRRAGEAAAHGVVCCNRRRPHLGANVLPTGQDQACVSRYAVMLLMVEERIPAPELLDFLRSLAVL
jgi:hypothetical protein